MGEVRAAANTTTILKEANVMATHVVKGRDGETVYLNDAEYKKYKREQSTNGCIVGIVVIIIAVWVALSGRSKPEKQADGHSDATAIDARTVNGE